jgi:hypothetical protein
MAAGFNHRALPVSGNFIPESDPVRELLTAFFSPE